MREWGVICGADVDQEWLLPWWWSRYSTHNGFPVTFCDFGMTREARAWCAERGEVVTIPFDTAWVAGRESVDPERIADWESRCPDRLWQARPHWFKKPFALAQFPYQRNIWLDLDCEVLGPLDRLFALCTPDIELWIVHDNSGVLVFPQGSPLVKKWAEEAVALNHLFLGDDWLLSYLITREKSKVIALPDIWNWRIANGFHGDVVIVHWVGSTGKEAIRKTGGITPILDVYAEDCFRNFIQKVE